MTDLEKLLAENLKAAVDRCPTCGGDGIDYKRTMVNIDTGAKITRYCMTCAPWREALTKAGVRAKTATGT